MTDSPQKAMLEMLYEKYYDELVLHCLVLVNFAPELREYVEECVQDVFIKAINNHHKLQNHPDLVGWLFLACANRMKNVKHTYKNRKKRHAFSLDANPQTELADPSDAFQELSEKEDYDALVERLYKLLVESEKQIFDDFFVQGYSIAEIEKRTGRSQSAIKSSIFRMRQRFIKKHSPPLIIFFVIDATFRVLNNWIK